MLKGAIHVDQKSGSNLKKLSNLATTLLQNQTEKFSLIDFNNGGSVLDMALNQQDLKASSLAFSLVLTKIVCSFLELVSRSSELGLSTLLVSSSGRQGLVCVP